VSDQERDRLEKNDDDSGAEDVEAHRLEQTPAEGDKEAGGDDDVEAHRLY
jgi:hypothetical protein